MGEPEFYKALSDFIAEKQGVRLAIDGSTDLLASGAIDSLVMVEVLMLIEQLSGEPVDPDLLEPELFERADRLYRTFFGATAVVDEQ